MSQPYDQLCTWCQTEIIWDPEIGPEDTCPHCFNELGQYRSIQLNLKQPPEESSELEQDDEQEDELDDYDDDFDMMDEYEEGVQRMLDTQEEAPECSACHSLMMLAGHQAASPNFTPITVKSLKQPVLKQAYNTRVYVCPSCFKVEHILSEEDRMELIEQMKKLGAR